MTLWLLNHLPEIAALVVFLAGACAGFIVARCSNG